jgi:hypothetical protein
MTPIEEMVDHGVKDILYYHGQHGHLPPTFVAQVLNRIYNDGFASGAANTVTTDASDMYKSGVESERKRCAEIARELHTIPEHCDNCRYQEARVYCNPCRDKAIQGEAIATAIEKGKEV